MSVVEQQIKVLQPWLVSNEGAGEWRGFCIGCEKPQGSKSPSAGYNFTMGVMHCMGKCGMSGQIKTLVRKIKAGELPSNVVQFPGSKPEKSDGSDPKATPLPDSAQLRRWHKALIADDRRMQYLREKRGITDVALLKRLLVGWDRKMSRYTIPIFDQDGTLVNVRMYKPNARSSQFKMISWGKGNGTGRIYGFDTLADNDNIVLVEGEWDRIVSLQEGLPAVTDTGGSKVFKPEWAKHFKGKNVYVAYDDDDAGKRGAQKARRVLEEAAEYVYGVTLELDSGKDMTDFFLAGRTADDFRARMGAASLWFEKTAKHAVPTKGKRVNLHESQQPGLGNIEVISMVAGKAESFLTPAKLVGECSMSAGSKCNTCYFAANDGHREKTFTADDPDLLQFMGKDVNTVKQRLYPKLLEANCTTHVTCYATEQYSIEELIITPSVQHRGEGAEPPIQRTAYSVGTHDTTANSLVRLVGQQRPHPQNQNSILHAWVNEPIASDIDTFKMTPEIMKSLKRFQPDEGQTPLEKAKDIADDIAANVTHIYGRPLLHVGYDLVWHSATSFIFGDQMVTKGWLECLVIGDTRTGKSETANRLIKHYKAGVLRPLEGASFAGLVGGAEQHGKSTWMVKWGLIPLNDRRLVVLDEMSGLFAAQGSYSKGIIEEMSSIRSEGKAMISKMGNNETSARTRLVWISNPLDPTPLNQSYGGCINALRDLVRNPEDIARFDFVMAAAQDDVDTKIINSTSHRRVKHEYTTTASSQLVMWAWSRSADQIVFSSGVEDLIIRKALDLGARYVEDPPLIQRANVRLKIARIAVAMAARTFSTDRTGEKIVVQKRHVTSAAKFLDEVYGQQAMGYREHSERVKRNEAKAEESMAAARAYLSKNDEAVGVLALLGGSPFKHHDFMEMAGMDDDEARTLIAHLTKWNMVRSHGRYHQKKATPQLLRLVKELEDNG